MWREENANPAGHVEKPARRSSVEAPVIDGIEEHDPAGRIEQLAQDSDLDRALRIEELDFLDSSPHDH